MVNELTNLESIQLKSNEFVDMINVFRVEEGNRKELKHYSFMKSFKKEIETLESLKQRGAKNIFGTLLEKKESTYIDCQGNSRPCFILNREQIIYMGMKESTYVRNCVLAYVVKLENRIKELTKQLYEQALKQIPDTRSCTESARVLGYKNGTHLKDECIEYGLVHQDGKGNILYADSRFFTKTKKQIRIKSATIFELQDELKRMKYNKGLFKKINGGIK